MVNFINGEVPINDTNLNKLQKDLQDNMETRITTGQEVATNEYIDDKQVYRKRISGIWGTGDSLEINCGLSGISYIPQRFEAFIRGTTGNLFNINTPRANGTDVEATQTWGYWAASNDKFICNHQGYTREGSIVNVNLYYTKNNE